MVKQGNLLHNINSNVKTGICHLVNNIGVMGAGFALSLRQAYPCVYSREKYQLGNVDTITINDRLFVFHMCGQDGIWQHGPKQCFVVYDKLAECMTTVKNKYKELQLDVLMCPKFGSGLAGGSWNTIEKMIADIWCDINVEVWVQ